MTNADTQTQSSKQAVSIRTLSIVMGVLAVLLSLACLLSIQNVARSYREHSEAIENYFSCQNAANEMSSASDMLTSEVRLFVTTQDPRHLDHYFEELNVTKRRDKAMDILESHLVDTTAQNHLNQAFTSSNDLAKREMYAMKLVLEATGTTPPASAAELDNVTLLAKDVTRDAESKIDLANNMVFGSEYQRTDDFIEMNVRLCKDDLLNRLGADREQASTLLDHALMRLELCIVLIVVDFLVTLVGFAILVLRPLYGFVRRIEQSEPLDDAGSSELRYLSSTYNAMYEESRRTQEHLKRKSELDALTGIYNRDVFSNLLEMSNDKQVALLLIDIDHFKEVNDTYGHIVGDRVLQKVAQQLKGAFRQSDFPCRIGGDEFAVLMTGADSSMEPIITSKIEAIRTALCDTSDGLPVTTLSIGIAFGPLDEDVDEDETLYKHADEALYVVKEAGRNGMSFWSREDH